MEKHLKELSNDNHNLHQKVMDLVGRSGRNNRKTGNPGEGRRGDTDRICCTTALLLHHYCTITALLLHYYCTITALLLHYYCTITAPLLHYYCTITALLLHHYCTITAPLLHYYCTITAPLLHYYCTITALLLHYYCMYFAQKQEKMIRLGGQRSLESHFHPPWLLFCFSFVVF